jgi:hypothetical protein
MRFALRDAAVGYASRGIPVLPLHYPIIRPQPARPLPAGPAWAVRLVDRLLVPGPGLRPGR